MNYEFVYAGNMPDRLRPLFAEYQDYLIMKEPELAKVLDMQGYEEELAHLLDKYEEPEGGIYIIVADGKDAGCIAYRKLTDENAEIKRLYLREEFRGNGFGRKMIEKVITEAKKAGYKRAYSDTLPIMKHVWTIQEELGFERTEKYYPNPLDYAIYYKLEF